MNDLLATFALIIITAVLAHVAVPTVFVFSGFRQKLITLGAALGCLYLLHLTTITAAGRWVIEGYAFMGPLFFSAGVITGVALGAQRAMFTPPPLHVYDAPLATEQWDVYYQVPLAKVKTLVLVALIASFITSGIDYSIGAFTFSALILFAGQIGGVAFLGYKNRLPAPLAVREMSATR